MPPPAPCPRTNNPRAALVGRSRTTPAVPTEVSTATVACLAPVFGPRLAADAARCFRPRLESLVRQAGAAVQAFPVASGVDARQRLGEVRAVARQGLEGG